MSEKNAGPENGLLEIRQVRQEAERLRDQLSAEYGRLEQELVQLTSPQRGDPRWQRGREAMHKAILAINKALESIDQALLEMEHARNKPVQ